MVLPRARNEDDHVPHDHRLKDGGIAFHLQELTGKVHLNQYDAVYSINPDVARRTLDAPRVEEPAA